jgi:NAD(P)-dependent dehydrogenase (short-subunit alcohol dehydrogenase family)
MAQYLSGPSSLTGQVALITGGSGGMGRAIANAFKAAGARVGATVPLGSYGNADDIAQAALFLSSASSNWITGTSLDISGGMWMD